MSQAANKLLVRSIINVNGKLHAYIHPYSWVSILLTSSLDKRDKATEGTGLHSVEPRVTLNLTL